VEAWKRIHTKFKMKIREVSILMMIVLSLIGGEALSCHSKCKLECLPLIAFTPFYLICINGCIKKCKNGGRSTVAVPDCNSSCGLINYTGIYLFTKSFSLLYFVVIM